MWKRATHVGCFPALKDALRALRSRRIAWYVACFTCADCHMSEGTTMQSSALSLVEPGRRVSVRELERWASLAAASAVIAYGFSRRTMPGVCLAAAAAPIAY